MNPPRKWRAGEGATDLMRSLPAWASLLLGSIRKIEQRSSKDGKLRTISTLPMDKMLTPGQRSEIEAFVTDLEFLLDQTPESSAHCRAEALLLITKMLIALPSARQNEIDVEAIGESYEIALQDLPSWAAGLAVAAWYRGECGNNARGEPYDYAWRPSPADLRAIALAAAAPVSQRLKALRELLATEALVERDEEHCKVMCEQLSALARRIGKA
jgi:hypothetical protein